MCYVTGKMNWNWNIPRNEMGHRYYTKENIAEFQRIKELKEQGYQLKAIRMIVHNGPIEGLTAEAPDSRDRHRFQERLPRNPAAAVVNWSRHSRQQWHSRCSNPCSRCSPLHPSSFR